MIFRHIPINKRSDAGKLKQAIDKLFRQILLIERPHKCEWCKKETQVYVCHVLPKGRYPRLRYVELNVLLLCYYCHMIRWHKNPLEANAFMESRASGSLEELKMLDKTMQRHDTSYLQLLHHAKQRELEALKELST